MSCFSYFVAVLWGSMNELQRLIRQSFDTKKKIYPAWQDPDGIFHEESVSYITPYCEDMDELAVKCGLSRSQLYRKLANPISKFKINEVEELHKQLHWHEHQSFDGESVTIDVEATKEIITNVRRDLAVEEALDPEGRKDPVGRYGRATRRERFEDLVELQQTIKRQHELIDRLTKLAESQQEIISKLTDTNQAA